MTALSNFFGQFTINVVGNLLRLMGVLALLFRESVWVGASMTLFARVSPEGSVYEQVIDRYYDGQPDRKTIELLDR